MPQANNRPGSITVQRILIDRVLDPLGALTRRMSDRAKDCAFVTALLLIILHSFVRGMYIVHYRYLYYYAPGCLMLGIMIVSGIRGPLKPVRFSVGMTAAWFVFAALLFLSGLIDAADYLAEALLILVAYPIFFVVWGNTGYKKLFHLLSRAVEISFYVFVIVSYAISPISRSKYAWLFENVNGAAAYLSIVFCALMFLAVGAKSRAGRGWYIFALAFCLSAMFYTNSRTGMLSVVMACAAAGVFCWRKLKKAFWLSALGFALAVVACLFGTVFLFQTRKYIPLPVLDYDEMVFKDVEELYGDSEFFGLDEFWYVSEVKYSTEGKDLDSLSTGRITYWKAYLSETGLRGHGSGQGAYLAHIKQNASTAHNTILQYAYSNGILAGLAFFALNIFTGIRSCLFCIHHRETAYAIFPLIITVAFGVTSLLAACTSSFWYMLLLLYYLVQAPVILEIKEETA